jgi:hypothetical protein
VRAHAVALMALAAVAAHSAAAGSEPKLPPETLRGPAPLLDQYPTVSVATPPERAAAERMLADLRARSVEWRDPRGGARAGFRTRRPRRADHGRQLLYFHAEHRGYHADDRYLDLARPETIVYADAVGHPLVLIGVMFSMPRGLHGPTPGGPITRWHTHLVCARGAKRGLSPRADGSCPPGTKKRQGSEMMHIWFTRDLRSAYAIHAPVPELCTAELLPREHCGQHGGHHP